MRFANKEKLGLDPTGLGLTAGTHLFIRVGHDPSSLLAIHRGQYAGLVHLKSTIPTEHGDAAREIRRPCKQRCPGPSTHEGL